MRHPASLSLAFVPGEAAQVDWGCADTIVPGHTRCRLSFCVMVLCHSRMTYVEFTCGDLPPEADLSHDHRAEPSQSRLAAATSRGMNRPPG